MKTINDLGATDREKVVTMLQETNDAISMLSQIPFGENRASELKNNLVEKLILEFGLERESLVRTIDWELASVLPINFDILETYAKGLPNKATNPNLMIHQDGNVVSFGTFRVILDEVHAIKKPGYVTIVTTSDELDLTAQPGTKYRPYIAILLSVPTKKWAIAKPILPGSALAQPIHSFEFPEKVSNENTNVFILYETTHPEQHLSIAREVKQDESITLLVISTNPDEKQLSNN